MERVALKILRRKYASDGIYEIDIHERIRNGDAPCREIAGVREAFLHDGRVCIAFDLHGRSLDDEITRRPLSLSRTREVTRQLLHALAHLHRHGLVHTDVKPDNVLYEPRSREARLADLGSVMDRLRQGSIHGTREYLAPEVLIGAPLSPAIDMWSLGCTIFEMLTGNVLFSPRAAAAKKYLEFSDGPDAIEVPLAESVGHDRAVERAEQMLRGAVIGGKYRLDRTLGNGRFGTVWSAQKMKDTQLNRPSEALRKMLKRDDEDAAEESEKERQDRAWRRAKGADDLVDLTLNYEHALLMASLSGPFPAEMVSSAHYRASYFEEDGELRFRPRISRTSLRERLRREAHFTGDLLRKTHRFLERFLFLRPENRWGAEDALADVWLLNRGI